ncbi:MAG: T9SS type A sorting domain-containing protein [Bacteroidota bacterium]|jgi:Zn-dependent metalloprotease
MKKIFLWLIAVGLNYAICFAQDSTQLAAWHDFNGHYAGKWIVRWDKAAKTPSSIYGFKSDASPQISEGAGAVAKSFFEKNAKMFKMRSKVDQLTMAKELIHRGMHHMHFVQTYSGIPVDGGEYDVSVASDGSLRMVCGNFIPEIELDVKASITSTQSEQTALQSLNIQSLEQPQSSELVILPKNGEYVLAYKVKTTNRKPFQNWLTMVDAKTGKVIYSEDITAHAVGSGYVYRKDPISSSLTTETLPGLDGTGYLEGTYVNVLNLAQSRAYSPSAQFFYTPPLGFLLDNTHFDEVNVYYHIDLYANHLATDLGFTGLGQVVATCHVGHGNNPGQWNNGVELNDGDGVNYGDAAKEDDWIYHEYQHGVSDYIGLQFDKYNQYGRESSALQEGVSDYFAASFANDPRIGRFTYSTASSTGDARNVANDPNYFNYTNYDHVQYAEELVIGKPDGQHQAYVNNYGDEHANGMIWSGLLWDTRSQLGANITDNLALKALYLRNGYATFAQEGEALIVADIVLYNGIHISTIQNYLNQRGINWSSVASTMAVMPTTVESFGNVIINTNSSEKGYLLFGANLLPLNGNITVTAPGGFQVSTTSGSGYASSISVAYTGGSITAKNVYVRFTPTAVQSYSGNITNSHAGAPPQYVAVSGAGVPSYTISGHISFMGFALVGATMNGLPGSPTTNSSGNYTATVPSGWFGPVTPSLSNFSFTPVRTTYSPVYSNITTNYTAGLGKRGANQFVELPREFALLQNVPNPFNPTTTIYYSIVEPGNVELKVYDCLGREVETLVNSYKNAGTYSVNFNASRLASGVYFYKIQSEKNVSVKKMLLLK